MQLEYESVTFGYTFKAEYFLADNTTLTGQFNRDPWNPITRPINYRRRRHALLVDDNEHTRSRDPIETELMERNSIAKDRYEKYDVEAIEIDSGLSGGETDNNDEEDNPYGEFDADTSYDAQGDENDEVDDEGEEEEQQQGNHETQYSHLSKDYWNKRPKDLSTARWMLFKGIEMLAQKFVSNFLIFMEAFLALSLQERLSRTPMYVAKYL